MPADQTSGATDPLRLQAIVLLAATAILTAVILALSSRLSSDASTEWERAVIDQVKQGVATAEDVRFVFHDVAAASLSATTATIRAEEYERRSQGADGDTREGLHAQALAQQNVHDNLLAQGTDLFVDLDQFETSASSLLVRRLAEEQAEGAPSASVDPDQEQAKGDALARRSVLMMVMTVPAAIAFLMGTLAQTSRRRGTVVAGWILVGVAAVGALVVQVVG